MKVCNNCHSQVEETAGFCPYCGANLQTAEAQRSDDTPAYNANNAEQQAQNYAYATAQPAPAAEPDLGNGNIIAGIVGAVLFGLIGGLLYFAVYQLGFIAGICGLVIFILANFGYHLFAKGNKTTKIGIIVSIITTVVMIYASEYFCLSYEIFKAYKEIGITFSDAVKATPEFLSDPEVKGAVVKDLLVAYALGAVASISTIINTFKKKK